MRKLAVRLVVALLSGFWCHDASTATIDEEISSGGMSQSLEDRSSRQGGRLIVIGREANTISPVNESGLNTYLVLPGTRLTGAVSGMTDGSALQANFGLVLSKFSTSHGDESNFVVSTRLAQMDIATPSYQKNGIYVRLVQEDGSSFLPSAGLWGDLDRNFHDGVGVESQAIIPEGNLNGRVFGYHGAASVSRAADGRSVVAEFESINSGSAQPRPNFHDSKIGINLVARGTSFSTVGLSIASAEQQKWFTGIVVHSNSVSESAFAVRDLSKEGGADLAQIRPNGGADFTTLTVSHRPVLLQESGVSSQRPRDLTEQDAGRMFFDRALLKPLWWAGSNWVDSAGVIVP